MMYGTLLTSLLCLCCCRHESELKDNNYWLGLLTHLQSPDVPYKRVECLRDLRSMYESATIDDLYDAYTRFDFSDEAVFTCVGTSGKAPPPPPDRARLDALVSALDGSARGGSVQSAGWGGASSSSSSGGPGGAALPVDWAAAFSKAFGAAMQQQGGVVQAQAQQQQVQQQQQQQVAPSQQQEDQQQGKPDPMAMFTAMLAAAQGAKLAQALGKDKQQQEQQNGDGSSS
jgi:hypothetical protein